MSETPESVFDYHDVNGVLRYQVLRFPNKKFRQRNANGQWSLVGVEPLPYRLPQWINRQAVIIAEGEKDADNLWSYGLPATTNSGGASWPTEINGYFADMSVFIFPDNDEPGKKRAVNIIANLKDIANSIRIFKIPANAPEKYDATDWLKSFAPNRT